MIALAAITASVWVAVGAWVGWNRARETYWRELERYPVSSTASTREAERYATGQALLVLYVWTTAGVLGALLWFVVSVILMMLKLYAEENASSSNRRGSDGLFWLLASLFAITVVNEYTLANFRSSVDALIVRASIIMHGIAFFVLAYLLG